MVDTDIESRGSLASSYSSTSCMFTLELEYRSKASLSQPSANEASLRDPAASAEAQQNKSQTIESEFSPERYLLFHKRATLHRARVGPGRSHEMSRLYNFWLSFLPAQYNDAMYQAFKRYAEEDASAGYTAGLTSLFQFYLRFLSNDFEPEVYRDFETLALKYQDYLDFEDGMECLCQFLTTASSSIASQLVNKARRPSTSGSTPTPTPAASTSTSCATSLPEQTLLSGAASSPVAGASLLSTLSVLSSSSNNLLQSASNGMLLVAPGQPLESGVEVDVRVLEQLQAWQAARAAKAAQGATDESASSEHALRPESVTGSSEAGGDGEAAAAALPPKRLGRRPNGKLAQALRRAGARYPSPPAPTARGTSPPPPSILMAGSAPTGAGRYMAAAAAKFAASGAQHGAGSSAGMQQGGGKRSRHGRSQSSKRGQTQQPHEGAGAAGAANTPLGDAVRSFARSQSARGGGSQRAVAGKPVVHVTPGSRAIQAELDLWEAQPCVAMCGVAAQLPDSLD